MPQAHEGLRYLARFEIVHDASKPNDVLELTTDNDKFRCLVTREMFLRLSAAFARHVQIVDAEGSRP
jgi:hypothetical protein